MRIMNKENVNENNEKIVSKTKKDKIMNRAEIEMYKKLEKNTK